MKKANLILITIPMIAILLTSCNIGDSKGEATAIELSKSMEVTIGKQVWMTKNLNVEKFRNGDPIPEAKTAEDWYKAGINKQPAWCYYNNNPDNEERFGKLYNWFAVNDQRGLAPEGWKIPSDEDWSRLTDFLGGEKVAGNKMKFNDFWNDLGVDLANGTNESGFSALPAGRRFIANNYDRFDLFETFEGMGESAIWWSSTEFLRIDHRDNELSTEAAWVRSIGNNYWKGIERFKLYKGSGVSVRCLKD